MYAITPKTLIINNHPKNPETLANITLFPNPVNPEKKNIELRKNKNNKKTIEILNILAMFVSILTNK